jgi:two-component system nitrogen regulation response regulator NtrX
VNRIGASKPIKVDVRVIAATNKTLEEEIAAGRFREDLLYRLNVVPVQVPPLRQRREDIPLLVERFAAEFANGPGLARKTFQPDAIQALAVRDWPGNVRELRNAVERLMILSSSDGVTAVDVARLGGATADTGVGDLVYCETFDAFKQQAERAFLTAKLAENGWNVSETARKLDMPRSNLYKKIERYGLQRGNE